MAEKIIKDMAKHLNNLSACKEISSDDEIKNLKELLILCENYLGGNK
jgi:hypothetical protein